jgi:hypothetical protein
MHLVFFLAMNSIDTNINRNRHDLQHIVRDEDLQDENFLAQREIKKHELEIFEI